MINDVDWSKVIKSEPIKIKTGGGIGIEIVIAAFLMIAVMASKYLI